MIRRFNKGKRKEGLKLTDPDSKFEHRDVEMHLLCFFNNFRFSEIFEFELFNVANSDDQLNV